MRSTEDFVFHFTSAGAALSIVTSRQLWATNVEYLNDRFEGQLPNRALTWMVEKPDVYLPGVTAPQKHLEALRCSLSHGRVAYASSFSEHYRSLPQYRMYCPETGGYAVGFPRAYLSKIGMFIKCDYSNSNLMQWCSQYAKEFLADASALDNGDLSAEDLSRAVTSRKTYIHDRVMAALTFKSNEFVNELEHRLVAIGLAQRFRESPGRNLIVPYGVIDLPNEDIEVVIASGPNRSPDFVGKTIGFLSIAAKEFGTKWNIGPLGTGEYGFRA
ncbi:MAG TPA: hypothetical protein VFW73_01465 [Lacipirellulaceae bacterium]|nr:hypothetical protein [Lacipirellulaceae bacterium]